MFACLRKPCLYVANFYAPSATIYQQTAKGNVAPLHTIGGSKTALHGPYGIAVDASHKVYVVNTNGGSQFTGSLTVYAALVQVASVLDATGMGGAPPWQGWWGANAGASSKPFNLAVTSVDSGGPAADAGLRRGDLIDIRANTLVERYSLFEVPLNGRPLTLSVPRGSLQRSLRSYRTRQNLRGASRSAHSRLSGFCCLQL